MSGEPPSISPRRCSSFAEWCRIRCGPQSDRAILEFDRTDNPFRQAVIQTPLEHENGVVAIPIAPGLGIEINRDALKEFQDEGRGMSLIRTLSGRKPAITLPKARSIRRCCLPARLSGVAGGPGLPAGDLPTRSNTGKSWTGSGSTGSSSRRAWRINSNNANLIACLEYFGRHRLGYRRCRCDDQRSGTRPSFCPPAFAAHAS